MFMLEMIAVYFCKEWCVLYIFRFNVPLHPKMKPFLLLVYQCLFEHFTDTGKLILDTCEDIESRWENFKSFLAGPFFGMKWIYIEVPGKFVILKHGLRKDCM